MGKNYTYDDVIKGVFASDALTASEDWIYITPNVEKFNNIVTKDTEDGYKISDASNSISNVKNLVASTVIMGKGEGGQAQDTEIGNIATGIDDVIIAKAALAKVDLAGLIKAFNDKLEKEKVKAIRKTLRAAAKSFNAMNKVKRVVTVPAGRRGAYSWPESTYNEYDRIDYDFCITSWDTFLDMKTDTLYTELINRENKYGITLIDQGIKDSMVRPEDT